MSTMHFFQLFFLFSFSILLFMSTNMQTISAATSTKKTNTKTSYKNFIKTACNSTRFPKDCNKALSPYASTIKADPKKLCSIALSLTLNATCNASASIESVSKMKGLNLNPSEKAIVSDCTETAADAIEMLNSSLKAMANLKGKEKDREAQMDNIKTWVSAALTDDYTCTDEFEGQKVSKAVNNTIKKTMLYVAVNNIKTMLYDCPKTNH